MTILLLHAYANRSTASTDFPPFFILLVLVAQRSTPKCSCNQRITQALSKQLRDSATLKLPSEQPYIKGSRKKRTQKRGQTRLLPPASHRARAGHQSAPTPQQKKKEPQAIESKRKQRPWRRKQLLDAVSARPEQH